MLNGSKLCLVIFVLSISELRSFKVELKGKPSVEHGETDYSGIYVPTLETGCVMTPLYTHKQQFVLFLGRRGVNKYDWRITRYKHYPDLTCLTQSLVHSADNTSPHLLESVWKDYTGT